MASKCPKCDKTVYFGEISRYSSVEEWVVLEDGPGLAMLSRFCLDPGEPALRALYPGTWGTQSHTPRPQAEKVSSLGKDWHKFCLKCERCSKTLTPGGHAEHDGKPFCHKPCYATLFGPKGVNIGGAGSYIYEKPLAEGPQVTGPIQVPVVRAEERKASGP
ncbi:Cysteine-rich protein 2 [Sciurus carolinensis]|uniref:Cysteine-rich protein 2 n=1 Tax=Sciurus carolinensis TaxID=30640 RepID=A0AA41T9V0_SCICA|nr:Cysteine-rich protein 2 [Sciurus carolinensis]